MPGDACAEAALTQGGCCHPVQYAAGVVIIAWRSEKDMNTDPTQNPWPPAQKDSRSARADEVQVAVVHKIAAEAIEQSERLPVWNPAIEHRDRRRGSPILWEFWVFALILIAAILDGLYQWFRFLL
ncbi:hypothetical protein GCM10011515_23840 [Tsuneonella deserti]|uniref:Preprotein translocase subunit SecE n=1 Tax=Tsuneonella deserti TaxID=2035528 RepID=A0ABQ1S9Y4_9SPHN|nr:hypothetical protein GCM10011515_23840 [Tsuneonella deserti]